MSGATALRGAVSAEIPAGTSRVADGAASALASPRGVPVAPLRPPESPLPVPLPLVLPLPGLASDALSADTAPMPVTCKKCGEPLTDPRSISRQYGSACWRAVRPDFVRPPRWKSAASARGMRSRSVFVSAPDQEEIDFGTEEVSNVSVA